MPPIRTSFNVIPGNPYPQGLPSAQSSVDPDYGVTPDQQRYIMNTSGNYWVGKQNIENQKAANAQYMYELVRNANNTKTFNAATGQNIDGAIDFENAQKYVDAIRENNQNANTNDYLNGGPLKLDPHGKIDPALVQQYKTRQGVVSDTGATMGYLPKYATGKNPGFYNGPIGQGVSQQMNPPLPPMFTPDSTLQNPTEQQPTISTGVGQTSWGNQDPFSIGVPSIPELTIARNNEQQNANTLYGHNVTNAHYGRADANERIKANADALRARKYNVYPPAGQSPINQANTVSQMLDRQLKAVEGQMETEGFMEKNKLWGNSMHPPTDTSAGGKDWFGNPKFTPEQQTKWDRFQALNNTRQQLLHQLSGVPNGNLPFGGQATANLKGATIKGQKGTYRVP